MPTLQLTQRQAAALANPAITAACKLPETSPARAEILTIVGHIRNGTVKGRQLTQLRRLVRQTPET